MKYIFDVNERNNKIEIKLDVIADGNYTTNSQRSYIIEYNPEQQNWSISLKDLLLNIIDNIRLTVEERKDAYHNSDILINYLYHDYLPNKTQELMPESDPLMILE